jgi:drug/metabolite transporter (DMT)-like permease
MTAAFAVVYLVWGSTYLAIRVAVQDVPPGLLAGLRFSTAGLVLVGAALLRGSPIPRSWRAWRVMGVMGMALVVAGNGFVTWAEQWVPSNQTALIIASSAFWMAWFGTFGPRGTALTTAAKIGLAVGFTGVVLLAWPQAVSDKEMVLPTLAVLGSSLAWCGGTIYGRNADLGLPPLVFAGGQMLIGGVVLTTAGLLAGEAGHVQWTLAGVAGLLYLTIFGSCLAYGTYMWLIQHTTPARLGTIAYVNPAVATVLGWWILDERLVGPQLVGMVVILAGVILVARAGRR